MTFNNMKDLFTYEIRDLYNAERQLTEALPKMAQAASSQDLKGAFNEHLEETRTQVGRLERIFDELGVQGEGEKCEAMEGLIKEGEEVINEDGEPNVKDAALIAAAQRVEHYEMAGYGAAHNYAKQLDYSEAASLLKETLNEEKSADEKLNKIAKGGLMSSGVNKEATKPRAA